MLGTGGFLNPEKLLQSLNLIKPGMKIADFGCGAGYFALPLAKMVGKDGKITALDILPSALRVVESRAKMEGFFNIKTIRCNLENPHGSTLPDESQDLVLLANILFQSRKKEEILKEAKRIAKQNGKIILIDWLPKSRFTTDEGWRISPEEAQELAEKQGLKFEKAFRVDDYHYGLIFTKA